MPQTQQMSLATKLMCHLQFIFIQKIVFNHVAGSLLTIGNCIETEQEKELIEGRQRTVYKGARSPQLILQLAALRSFHDFSYSLRNQFTDAHGRNLQIQIIDRKQLTYVR